MFKVGDKVRYASFRKVESWNNGHLMNKVYTVSKVKVTSIGVLVWFEEAMTNYFAENLVFVN